MGTIANLAGVGIFALGIALLIFGFNSSGDTIRQLGSAQDRSALWLLVAGGISVLAGLVLAYTGRPRNE
jgi:hypothetical protein